MTATGKRPKRMAEELQPGPVVCAAWVFCDWALAMAQCPYGHACTLLYRRHI